MLQKSYTQNPGFSVSYVVSYLKKDLSSSLFRCKFLMHTAIIMERNDIKQEKIIIFVRLITLSNLFHIVSFIRKTGNEQALPVTFFFVITGCTTFIRFR